MESTTPVTPLALQLADDELTVVRELLESERDRLLVEIRHTDHRTYRDELRHRQNIVERLLGKIGIR